MRDFADRAEAGRRLTEKLRGLDLDDALVLALPRGGVPVAEEVASALSLPLDVLFVRRIGLPGQPELAAAAVVDGANPQMVRNDYVLERVRVDEAYLDRERRRELGEIERRRQAYCRGRPPAEVAGRTVLVVDDGVATGTTVKAAFAALRRNGAARLILAVPVIAPDTAQAFRAEGVEVIAVLEPADFMAVGQYYRDFRQLEDEEVIESLRKFEEEPSWH